MEEATEVEATPHQMEPTVIGEESSTPQAHASHETPQAEPLQCDRPTQDKHKIPSSMEEVQWRTSRFHPDLKESFMGAICPASLHTYHPEMKNAREILRDSWPSLPTGPRRYTQANCEFSHLTFDPVRIARTPASVIPPVEGCGVAASIILEGNPPVDIGVTKQDATSIEGTQNLWTLHSHKDNFYFDQPEGRTLCTAFTAKRPCRVARAHRYLIKFGHRYQTRGRPGTPQFVWRQRTTKLKITFFLHLFASEFAPLAVAVCEGMGRALAPQDLKGLLHFSPADPTNEEAVNVLLRLAWTGVIGVASSGPPCDTYSSLRERKCPGPLQLRSEDDVAGSWLTDIRVMIQTQTANECHYNNCLTLWVVHVMGGFIAKEHLPASLDNFEDCARCLIVRTGMKLVSVAGCCPRYVDDPSGIIYEKHFLWATTIPGFQKLGSLSTFWPDTHVQFGSKRNRGGGTSRKRQHATLRNVLQSSPS